MQFHKAALITERGDVHATVHVAVKVGFHYPSSRAELTARELGCIFLTPVKSGRELG